MNTRILQILVILVAVLFAVLVVRDVLHALRPSFYSPVMTVNFLPAR